MPDHAASPANGNDTGATGVFGYLRHHSVETAAVVLNFTGEPRHVTLPPSLRGARLSLSTRPDRRQGKLLRDTLDLATDEGILALQHP